MKQLYLGLGLTLLILVSGVFLGNRLESTHHPQARDLERAALCAGEEDWGQAAALLARARRSWESSRNLTAALVHHDPLNQIDTQFAELAVYAAAKSALDFRAGCMGLAQDLRSLPKSHSLSWWNLL
jgi:hypothetical protein